MHITCPGKKGSMASPESPKANTTISVNGIKIFLKKNK